MKRILNSKSLFIFTLVILDGLLKVMPLAAQEQGDLVPTKPTPWMQTPEETPDPDALPTPFVPDRPVHKKRRSTYQIMTPEHEAEEAAERNAKDRADEELDAVFGQ